MSETPSETQSPASQKPRAKKPAAVARYDEMAEKDGALRPQWQRVVARVRADDAGGLCLASCVDARAWSATMASPTTSTTRRAAARGPWELDPVPFVIGAADWKVIEAGIAQRAHLADLILRDIYGPQQLIKSGDIPPHLVFGIRSSCGR